MQCYSALSRIQRAHGFSFYAVVRASDALLLGYVGLLHVDIVVAFAPAIEIGWRLRADYWG